MKKILLIIFLLVLVAGAYVGWNIFGGTVSKPESKYFYVKTGATYPEVKKNLLDKHIIRSEFFFDRVARQAKYDQRIKPGRYEIRQGTSVINLVRMLKSGNQVPVRLVITKLRTREELAAKLRENFEADSMSVNGFLHNNDSLHKFGIDTNTALTIVIPNSYLFWWNSSVSSIIERLAKEKEKFWEGSRTAKAKALGLTPDEAYTLASIVEEETNQPEDKGKVASTYLNRIKKGMKLEADPTVKFAMRDFGLKRILRGHLQFDSPFNTYQNTGLPPGPICTPSIRTIDAVLNAPSTDYLFFVAKPDFKGYSNFASNYSQHLVYARAYQTALDSLIRSKNQP